MSKVKTHSGNRNQMMLMNFEQQLSQCKNFLQNLMKHFKTIPVAEKEALTYFIYMIKTNRSKLDRERPRDED